MPMQLVRIASTISTTDDSDSISALELDSHADSPVVGKKAFIIRKTGKRVNVSVCESLSQSMSLMQHYVMTANIPGKHTS